MPDTRDSSPEHILSRILEEHGLTPQSRLFREAERGSLVATGTAGVYRIAANPVPGESIVDVYEGPGYIVQAESVGPGLAFAETTAPNWQETMEMRTLQTLEKDRAAAAADRVEVAVSIEELLRQGGRMYPVESVMVERAWYFTLPDGSIEVREVSQ